MSSVYGCKSIRPEMMVTFLPPKPLTAIERFVIALRRSLEVGIVCIFGALAVTIAPVQTITAFVVSFSVVMMMRMGGR